MSIRPAYRCTLARRHGRRTPWDLTNLFPAVTADDMAVICAIVSAKIGGFNLNNVPAAGFAASSFLLKIERPAAGNFRMLVRTFNALALAAGPYPRLLHHFLGKRHNPSRDNAVPDRDRPYSLSYLRFLPFDLLTGYFSAFFLSLCMKAFSMSIPW